MELGPSVVVAKQGEYGAAMFTGDAVFALPGLPLEDVRDPTGAGDSFAGGFLGYLDGARRPSPGTERLREAMAYGTVLASFNVEDFGTERVSRLERGGDRRAPGRAAGDHELRLSAPRRGAHRRPGADTCENGVVPRLQAT